MPVYTTISRPSVPTYTEVGEPEYTIEFDFQDGENYLFQDGVQKVFAARTDEIFTTITRPSVPTYTTITQPS